MAGNKPENKLEVWIDCDFIGAPARVGMLSHDKGNVRFNYTKEWLEHPSCFDIDPDFALDETSFHPNPEIGNFGIFMDSSPDRWGQTLMKRREALEAKDLGREPHVLYAWDYLIGVQDFTRQGALRFKVEGTNVFLGEHPFPAPSVTSLRELAMVATELSSKRIEDLDALRKWLSVLVAPGASLGGARPKANITEVDGSLWIAKFPAKNDDYDIGAWEMLAHQLADEAGVDVPQAKLAKLNGDYHTFCVKRFDRSGGKRVFYASAMTMLNRSQSEGASYIDLAEFLATKGEPVDIRKDLEQLFRRVVFNVAVGNRDDHLRNHGFILGKDGWRLSPAFDINPNMDKGEHVLNLDDRDNRPNVETVLSTATYYEVSDAHALQIAEETIKATRGWREVAQKLKIAKAEIELMEVAFLRSA